MRAGYGTSLVLFIGLIYGPGRRDDGLVVIYAFVFFVQFRKKKTEKTVHCLFSSERVNKDAVNVAVFCRSCRKSRAVFSFIYWIVFNGKAVGSRSTR